jgi:quinolinate synthase
MSSNSLPERIRRLVRQRRAVILAHNYQTLEVQRVADITGDSLALARQAARIEADVIVLCGVHFMAETAKLVNPDRLVLEPDPAAGCPMANMITARQLREARDQHPDAQVVCYVNSTAAVKALSDICCTSANAVEVIGSLPADRPILFVPDQSLGDWVRRKTGRADMILWGGYCPTHHRITEQDVRRLKAEHPDALVLVHPECIRPVVDMADHVASTSGIIELVTHSDAEEFIIGTEIGLVQRLAADLPGKRLYCAAEFADCPNMKLVNLEKVLWSLEDLVYEVTIPPEVAEGARAAIERMLAV